MHQIDLGLRQELGFSSHQHLNLGAILDDGNKPALGYSLLAQLAIVSSPSRRLTLQEIYSALEAQFSYFRDRDDPKAAWKVRLLAQPSSF